MTSTIATTAVMITAMIQFRMYVRVRLRSCSRPGVGGKYVSVGKPTATGTVGPKA